jgi:hypothetical protein
MCSVAQGKLPTRRCMQLKHPWGKGMLYHMCGTGAGDGTGEWAMDGTTIFALPLNSGGI